MRNWIRRRRAAGFSLIEVVVATGIFAAAIVAIIGLLAPITRRVEDVANSDKAARLAGAIEAELRRLGFAWATATVPSPTGDPIYLVASADGTRVRLEVGGDADAALNVAMPGIAERDRFFRISVRQATAFVDGVSGSMTVAAEVAWPYRVPVGPASTTTFARFADGGDPWAEAPEVERSALVYFFVIRP